ncbi:outer membrane beta-barrel protein [Arsenicibacter rosenii]|uniref:Outer membrane protein beta-barrel domain-containing protein n=1 Tax=Arsenicibacter rosenii TaxID=1750698 RepID=A0A1S2VL27_9BACT|nr:outer membrane beta-barrel protein [Arsenicibacter rosenii]OIN58906.1 hypothetical protein BLX24_11825 [Arsenicibacter rosenii]
MKLYSRLIVSFIILLLAEKSMALTPGKADSLVIQFANKTRIVVHAPDKAGIKALSNYDLNKVIRDMGAKLDSIPDGQEARITIEGANGQRYLRDTVIVITKEKGRISVTIKADKDTVRSTSPVTRENPKVTDSKAEKARKKATSLNSFTSFQLGLNTLLTESEMAAYPSNRYDLKPLGSRYFALGIGQRPTLIKGKKARLSLQYGIEVAWNNYSFENDVTIQKGTTQLQFVDIQEAVKRTKLTICNVQLPIVPRVSFYNESGKKILHIGVGAYVGYRVDSYTKIKFEDGSKKRDHDRYYTNDLRYGIMAQLGIVRTNLFVKYELNPVFQAGKGPDVRGLSFGVIL